MANIIEHNMHWKDILVGMLYETDRGNGIGIKLNKHQSARFDGDWTFVAIDEIEEKARMAEVYPTAFLTFRRSYFSTVETPIEIVKTACTGTMFALDTGSGTNVMIIIGDRYQFIKTDSGVTHDFLFPLDKAPDSVKYYRFIYNKSDMVENVKSSMKG